MFSNLIMAYMGRDCKEKVCANTTKIKRLALGTIDERAAEGGSAAFDKTAHAIKNVNADHEKMTLSLTVKSVYNNMEKPPGGGPPHRTKR